MKILISAFEPFGGIKVNTSLEILNLIDNSFDKIVLPVTYESSFEVLNKKVTEVKPDLIIELGMAASREIISIEKRARNLLKFNIKDNSGLMITNKEIIENSNEYLYSKIDVEKICLNEFEYISDDAGTYICNYIYYMSLHNFNIPTVFIHIPSFNTLSKETILNEINNIICKLKESIIK